MAYDCKQDSLNQTGDNSRGRPLVNGGSSQFPDVSDINASAAARHITPKDL